MADRRWLRRLGSVRIRTTLAATLVVAAALSIGAVVTLDRFRTSLESNRRDAAVSRAVDLASLAASGHLPSLLGLPNQDATFAQVVGANGRVIGASANIAGEPPVGPPVSSSSGTVVRTIDSPVGQDGRYGLVAVPARMPTQTVTVYAAYSLATSDLAIREVAVGLVVGLPLLVALVGATAWIVVGRALRPIDAIRGEVAEITSQDLHRRVPEPGRDDEVARLALTMNSMLDRLETSVERQRAFVADASHELRSPLSSLRAQLEIGLAGGATTDWTATAYDALAEEARIERLVTDLLLLARLDATAVPLTGSTVDVNRVVEAEIAARLPLPGVTVRAHTNGARAVVSLDAALARRVVANLVENAQRHAESAVTVTVSTPSPDAVEVVVADDGPGIAPADRERVFQRFTRLDDSRTGDQGGAGLGLAIVRDIVARHGGTIVFGDTSVGARAVVRLPAAGP